METSYGGVEVWTGPNCSQLGAQLTDWLKPMGAVGVIDDPDERPVSRRIKVATL